MDVEVTVVDTASGSTDTVNFSTSLDTGQTKSVTVDGTTYDVNYDPAISGDEVAAGDSFQLSLGSGAGPDIEIANYDASVVWSESSGSSQVLYSDTYNEPAAASGGGVPRPTISTTLDTPDRPSRVEVDVNGGDSFDSDDNEVSFRVTLEDTSTGITDSETFSNDADVDNPFLYDGAAAGNPVFHQVGGGSVEYEIFAGSVEDFSSGESMDITITASDPNVEVAEVEIGIVEKSSGNVLWQTTVTP